ncbi:aminotransferase class IV [Pseudophaeobacter sp. EL27]|uniref:aminotransferase class IV n=1 Tax=Pseudophaeobacter sp. EL27 TaxID=2107580 RepID=UPI0013C447B4|nr:aminotransferase class IV [Pseudophaeobacter sp. EL27]
MSERFAYVNGRYVPERDAAVSIRDLGLVYGDSVFDTWRTFNGKIFKLEEHMDRLIESLAYARIDAGMSRKEMLEATLNLVEHNSPMLRPGEDYWVTLRVTGGLQNFDGEPARNSGATVVIDCIPIPLRARAPFFRHGIDARLTERCRIAPGAINPNAKTNNYLNMILAQKEISAYHPGAWALMPDFKGNIAEGAGCNFFVVQDGVVLTPTTDCVLAGVSRQVAIDVCIDLGIPVREQDLPYDMAVSAQEAFFTSTSLCVCPVASLNGAPYSGGVPGAVTGRIMEGFAKVVGMDYVGQYLNFLSDGPASTGL